MIRGTTPTLQFVLPFDNSKLSCLYITLGQKGEPVLEKCLTDCDCVGSTVICKLTQEDTLLLDCTERVEVQVRAKTKEGDSLASNIHTTTVGRILKEGVI